MRKVVARVLWQVEDETREWYVGSLSTVSNETIYQQLKVGILHAEARRWLP